MPKYFYKCLEKNCSETFETVHSMKEKLSVCSFCSGSIERVPVNLVNLVKNQQPEATQKAGTLVKKNIEEFRQDLKNEKKRLKKAEYK